MIQRWLSRGMFCFALTLVATAALGEEHLVVKPPKNWQQVYNAGAKWGMIIEFAPVGEDSQEWTDLLTVIVLDRPVPLRRYVNLQRLLWQRHNCKDENFFKIKPPVIPGYDTAQYGVFCSFPDRSKSPPGVAVRDYEFMIGLVILGRDNLYNVQRAYHENEDAVPLKEVKKRMSQRLDDWSAFFSTVRLCDDERGPQC